MWIWSFALFPALIASVSYVSNKIYLLFPKRASEQASASARWVPICWRKLHLLQLWHQLSAHRPSMLFLRQRLLHHSAHADVRTLITISINQMSNTLQTTRTQLTGTCLPAQTADEHFPATTQRERTTHKNNVQFVFVQRLCKCILMVDTAAHVHRDRNQRPPIHRYRNRTCIRLLLLLWLHEQQQQQKKTHILRSRLRCDAMRSAHFSASVFACNRNRSERSLHTNSTAHRAACQSVHAALHWHVSECVQAIILIVQLM